MNHERYRQWLQLAISDELRLDEIETLKQHLAECDACRSEFNELRQLKTVLGDVAAEEPSEQMLWQSRRNLADALRREAPLHSVLARMAPSATPVATDAPAGRPSSGGRSWLGWLQGFRLATAAAAAVVAGVVIGYLAFGGSLQQAAAPDQSLPYADSAPHSMGPADFANVRFVDIGSTNGEIELQYDLIRPVRLRAGVDDARMQRMLAYALLNEENDGVRLQAINAIGGETTPLVDQDVKRALIEAMLSDPNDGVRKQSLEVLKAFAFDADVKNACLQVLSRDDNPGMRVAVIDLLAQAVKQGSVPGPEIYDQMKKQLDDDDVYLRTASGAFIQEENDDQ